MNTKRARWVTLNYKKLSRSIWFFPVICLIALLLLTCFKISETSIGQYYQYFYGGRKDPSLLLNRPRPIRSDEWLTNTQMALSQSNSGFNKINKHIGNGEDTALILDVPYKDWSAIFRPQNWSFFVMPFDYAFAFKWWLLAYLLVISCYFFILYFVPRRRLLASILATSLFFSPFIQWWYQYITLAPIYYCLLLALVFMYLLKSKNRTKTIILGAVLSYLLVCFALVQYPPFQIACGLATLGFIIGYLIEQRTSLTRRDVLFKGSTILCGGLIAGGLVLGFIKSNQAAYDATENTAYPGHRSILSGDFDGSRLLSSNLAFQFQFTGKAIDYYFPTRGIANQSEASNFIFLMPFLVLPELLLIAKGYKQKRGIDWPLLTTIIMFVILTVRLITPYFNGPYKALLLSLVPSNRLIIGLGLLGVINLILLVRNLNNNTKFKLNSWLVAGYCLAVLAVQILVDNHIKDLSPGFVSTGRIVALSLPVPIIIYLLLKKRFTASASLLLIFSIVSTVGIHPLYKGTGVVSNSKLSSDIKSISASQSGKWIGEGIMLENYPAANGADTMSGVFTYPQLDIWKIGDPSGTQKDIYNRFAHVDFDFDRQANVNIPTTFTLRGGDNVLVTTEPCSQYLAKNNVHFILTDSKLQSSGSCAKLIDTVTYPSNIFFIYRLD